jgi:uroporphyrinogen-III synthase
MTNFVPAPDTEDLTSALIDLAAGAFDWITLTSSTTVDVLSAYRATILVQDPALDARSLKLSLQTKGGGAVSPETLNAVIDAILTRARQMRIADSKL